MSKAGKSLLASIAILASICAAARATEPNAAEFYKKAIALLPPRDHPDADAIADAAGEALTPAAIALVNKYDQVFTPVHEGAAIEKCDWGIDFAKSRAETPFTHLNSMKTLSRLADLRVRLLYQQNKSLEALNTSADMLVVSRHVSQSPAIVTLLVGCAMSRQTIEAVAEGLPNVQGADLAEFQARINRIPRRITTAGAFRGEATMTGNTLRALQEKDPLAVAADDGPLRQLLGPAGQDAGNWKAIQMQWLDPTDRSTAINEINSLLESLAQSVSKPYQQHNEAKNAWLEKQRAAGPLARAFVSDSLVAVYDRSLADVANIEMLKTGVAVCLEGENAVAKSRDPGGGKPIAYRKLPKGFELESAAMMKDKPVTLRFGEAQEK